MPAQRFPLGYPALELVGAEFVGNLTRYELMEFRILSGGHAAIAYPGALLGHHLVHDAMADPRIASWLDALTRREIQPTLSPVQGASDDNYRRLIAERFSNPRWATRSPGSASTARTASPSSSFPAPDRPWLRAAPSMASGSRLRSGAATAPERPMRASRSPNDENAEDLRARARAVREDPGAFVSQALVFGDLGQAPRFAEAFGLQIHSLW